MSFYIFIDTLFPLVGAFVFSLLLFFIGEVERDIKGSKLKTIYGEFLEDVFYISKQGIGVCKKFGTKDYILPSNCIQSLKFHFYSFYQDNPYENNYCIIEDVNGETFQFSIMNLLIERKGEVFLKALSTLTDKCSVSIHGKYGSDYNIYHNLEYMIKIKEYNITLCRD